MRLMHNTRSYSQLYTNLKVNCNFNAHQSELCQCVITAGITDTRTIGAGKIKHPKEKIKPHLAGLEPANFRPNALTDCTMCLDKQIKK